jgi:hypothetical protein
VRFGSNLVAFAQELVNIQSAVYRIVGIAALIACASACARRPAPPTAEADHPPSPAEPPRGAPAAISAQVREIKREGGRESIPDAVIVVDLHNPSARPCHVHQMEMSWELEGHVRQSIPELVVLPGGVATAQLRVHGPASIGLTKQSARVHTDGICGPPSLSIMLVDEEHAFMKALVGEVAARGSAPVTIGVDRWSHPETGEVHDPFLEADDPKVLRGYLVELGNSAVPDREHALVVGPSTDNRWRTYYLLRTSMLAGDLATTARVVRDPVTGPTAVEVELRPEASVQLRELTRNHIGKKLALLLDGKVMATPIIHGAIEGPKVTISAGDAAGAEALVARLRAKPEGRTNRDLP